MKRSITRKMSSKTFQIVLITSLLSLACQGVKGQYVLNEADQQYRAGNYSQAVELYNQAYKQKKSTHSTQQLADSYRELRNYKQAESWYAKLAGMAEPQTLNVFYYAQALRNNSKYTEARAQYLRFAALDSKVSRDELAVWISSCDSALLWMKDPKLVSLKNEGGINTDHSDWGASFYKDGLLFTSDRAGDQKVKKDNAFLKFDNRDFIDSKKYGRTGNPYLRLYQSIGDSVQAFPLAAGNELHVGPASISSDGTELFYTITRELNKQERKKQKGSGTISLNTELYSSRLVDGQWQPGTAFRYNNITQWSVGDPYLSRDGSQLYFVSDKPGGFGGMDIYVCQRAAGRWTDAVNLGPSVNTSGNERTPVIGQDGQLYFSSDGLMGMGGLDIYRVRVQDGRTSEVLNMGYPLNSPQDDLAFNFKAPGQGYLSSDREGGKGSDDIYSFVLHKKMQLQLEGYVRSKATQAVLRDAIVTLTDKATATRLRTQTDAQGRYGFILDSASVYDITAEKTNFRMVSAEAVDTKGLAANTTLRRDLLLEPIELNREVRINNILYDFDKWTIRPDAYAELDKLVQVLKSNPTLWIELGSHTDSRGGVAYNRKLSQRRAESVVNYLKGRGIEPHRLKAIGYGQSRLLNKCSVGVACTEAEHQLNRRTEFTIVEQ
ncbi:flagellar motor protein MotB [Pedobacter hiemivivus]|uniref:Flagellar motor protein MotB n=1 Tax=Pedobacter hiemivivus TaxID=2530454 RepID=A0A4V5PH19_9SPHI|nr:OmpA family protein [Pedobacter hiemivivus]TKC65226.1 flagellar motor protein MotB [Pedobacter hiemivivus]